MIDDIVAPPVSRFDLPEVRSVKLFTDRWVCVADAANPRLGEGVLSLEQLAVMPWVLLVLAAGVIADTVIDLAGKIGSVLDHLMTTRRTRTNPRVVKRPSPGSSPAQRNNVIADPAAKP